MKRILLNRGLKRFCWIVTLGLYIHPINAQDSTDVDNYIFAGTNRIVWIDQIPPLKQDIKKKKGWFKNLVFGEKEVKSIQKPTYILTEDDNASIILDQGHGTLFFIEDQKLSIPKVIKKKDKEFPSLISACLLPGNELLFTDSSKEQVYLLSANRKEIGVFNEKLKLSRPTGIAYSKKSDQIWLVETGIHQISILDRSGNRIKSFGKRGSGEGQFNFPTSIWIDREGLVYIVDALNFRVQIFDSDGNFISMFGKNGNGTGFMASPKGIATDSHGNIYVVDALFHTVQIFDQQGNYLYQFGKQGRRTEEFWMPSGIFIDESDLIYVVDSYNSRIQIFELNYSK
ncbi:6-bladed beta-propeller [Lutimonas zeaxanthinifaciens]|uniref:6-bladed beta-propeller n=1 Tax=Lutimonas zeaxanthinifaciens TaxID=3060215 RepID=UPI00265CAD4A|nr:6-bladed beta-propeller [Lutimonas sp. YSD2104]WKK67275.1 6-bladed beta-propeller [Lutimonas sp. YSD2104]